MNWWKPLLLSLGLAGLLWFLSPQRAITPSEPGIVEISFTGDPGANKAALDDAFLAFEAESQALHAKDPGHPIYRVIAGQSASRDQTSDPTRFLVSVAGGEPPDLILFDRYAVSEWAARGAFAKLDPYLAREAQSSDPDAIRAENYYPSAWEEVVYTDPITGERGTYGVPERVDDRALFYNKDLLKRAGYVDKQGADQRLYPLSFGLYAFSVFVTNPGTAKGMGMIMAGSLLMTLPVIVIFFFAQRYFLRGVTLTGMKG